jgi:hypothetical protein
MLSPGLKSLAALPLKLDMMGAHLVSLHGARCGCCSRAPWTQRPAWRHRLRTTWRAVRRVMRIEVTSGRFQ